MLYLKSTTRFNLWHPLSYIWSKTNYIRRLKWVSTSVHVIVNTIYRLNVALAIFVSVCNLLGITITIESVLMLYYILLDNYVIYFIYMYVNNNKYLYCTINSLYKLLFILGIFTARFTLYSFYKISKVFTYFTRSKKLSVWEISESLKEFLLKSICFIYHLSLFSKHIFRTDIGCRLILVLIKSQWWRNNN